MREASDEGQATSERLGANLRALRELRGITQAQAAKAAEIPRATWANLETGSANPTLEVLRKASCALQVSIEELLAPPRESARKIAVSALPTRGNAMVTVRNLVPEPLGGVQVERIELKAHSRWTGVPHRAGTREFCACERGTLTVFVGGEKWQLSEGEVLVFRGDQRHSYVNDTDRVTVGVSVVLVG
ncbi:MAG: XRE family transcriptional regulator [Deltaproteobacteria bacterium]|nr:XRE family transcriptional regulator [Deltaproteobacteria bacterium]